MSSPTAWLSKTSFNNAVVLCHYRGNFPPKREAVEVCLLYAKQSPMVSRDLQAPVEVGYVQGDAPQWCSLVYLPLDGLKNRMNGRKLDLAQRYLRAAIRILHVNDERALHIIFGLNENRHIVREVFALRGSQTPGVTTQEPVTQQHSNHAPGV